MQFSKEQEDFLRKNGDKMDVRHIAFVFNCSEGEILDKIEELKKQKEDDRTIRDLKFVEAPPQQPIPKIKPYEPVKKHKVYFPIEEKKKENKPIQRPPSNYTNTDWSKRIDDILND